MPEKKQDSFTVTDRRLFTSDGEMRQETVEEKPTAPPVLETPAAAVTPLPADIATQEAATQEGAPQEAAPPPPTAAEQQEQADAYRKSAKELDTRVELSGHSAKEMEMTFERFMASLYMSAMLQLGLMHEQGAQPRVD